MFSLLADSKPQISQQDNYVDHLNFNENYNYGLCSLDSSDEMIVVETGILGLGESIDNDSDGLLSGRMGKTLPKVPSYEKSTLNSSIQYM